MYESPRGSLSVPNLSLIVFIARVRSHSRPRRRVTIGPNSRASSVLIESIQHCGSAARPRNLTKKRAHGRGRCKRLFDASSRRCYTPRRLRGQSTKNINAGFALARNFLCTFAFNKSRGQRPLDSPCYVSEIITKQVSGSIS